MDVPSAVLQPNLLVPARISFPDLMATARSFPHEVRDDPNRLTFTMAVSVIRHFFGQPWCENHIIQDAAHSRAVGFMGLDFRPGFEGERKTSRVLDFAETLFNLQHIDGFDDRVDQMRAGQIEATFAEFDFGRFLYLHDIDFKLVKTSGIKGADYDCRIVYADGREACADAKCRLEGTEMRAETIRNCLMKARSKNLPRERAGCYFRQGAANLAGARRCPQGHLCRGREFPAHYRTDRFRRGLHHRCHRVEAAGDDADAPSLL